MKYEFFDEHHTPIYYDPAKDLVLLKETYTDTDLVASLLCSRRHLQESDRINRGIKYLTVFDSAITVMGVFVNEAEYQRELPEIKRRFLFYAGDICDKVPGNSDFQKERLYEAELPFYRERRDLSEQEAYALQESIAKDFQIPCPSVKILCNLSKEEKDQWVEKNIPNKEDVAYASAFYHQASRQNVYLAGCTNYHVCHEMAHAVTLHRFEDHFPAGHGPLFVRIYNQIARRYMTSDAVAEFDKKLRRYDLDASTFLESVEIEIDPIFSMASGTDSTTSLSEPLSFLKPLTD